MIEPKKVFQFRKAPNSATGKIVELFVDISADLPYFNGHFPQNPVLPGVAIVDASIEGLKLVIDRPELFIKKIQSAKFMDLVRPNDKVRVNFIEREPFVWMVSWWPASPSSAGTDAAITKKLAEIIFEI